MIGQTRVLQALGQLLLIQLVSELAEANQGYAPTFEVGLPSSSSSRSCSALPASRARAGHLFGSVTSADIAAELGRRASRVDRRKIQLAEPLKALGDYSVAIKLYREVTAHVKVKVLAEATEEIAEPVAEAVAAE